MAIYPQQTIQLPLLHPQSKTPMNSSDSPFSEETINAVWAKGQAVIECGSGIWRKDVFGGWMKRKDYGNHESGFGWEIGLIKPLADGGTHDLDNLRPLYWKNNRRGMEKKTCTPLHNANLQSKP